MSGTLDNRPDPVLTMQQPSSPEHEAQQVEHGTATCEGGASRERMLAKFCMEVRPLIEQAVARVNCDLATRPERCQLAEVSGYFTGPFHVGVSACNPLAYELRVDGHEVGETLLVELTHQGMIEAAIGIFRPTVSGVRTIRRDLGWGPVPLDKCDASIASDLVERYITALTLRWPIRARAESSAVSEPRDTNKIATGSGMLPRQTSIVPTATFNEGTVTDTMCNMQSQAPPRPAIDHIAEGMWRIVAGECCQESWLMLPEHQRVWWRGCATDCVRRWTTDAAGFIR